MVIVDCFQYSFPTFGIHTVLFDKLHHFVGYMNLCSMNCTVSHMTVGINSLHISHITNGEVIGYQSYLKIKSVIMKNIAISSKTLPSHSG